MGGKVGSATTDASEKGGKVGSATTGAFEKLGKVRRVSLASFATFGRVRGAAAGDWEVVSNGDRGGVAGICERGRGPARLGCDIGGQPASGPLIDQSPAIADDVLS